MADTCLEYTLRVACLQVLLEQRANLPKEAPLPPPPVASSSTASASTPNRRSQHEGSSGGGHFSFDLGSLIGRDSSKSPKFPEKMLKVLDGNLQRIAMGQDAKFSDQRFRRTAAAFWSGTWADKNFQRQAKDTRKVEDLILAFVTTATKSLKKEDELADGSWKYELSTQVSLFLDLIHSCLLSLGPISSELSSRIEGYRTRLKEPAPTPTRPNHLDRISMGSIDKGDGASIRSMGTQATRTPGGIVEEGLRGAGTEIAAVLFELNEDWLVNKLGELQGVCTEQAALDDFKTLLKRLNTDSPFPYGPYDFSDPAQWTAYRASEVSTLSQGMLNMMQANPSLSQTSEPNRFSNDMSSRMDNLRLDQASESSLFTYVPPDPRSTYIELLNRCLDWDLEVLKTLPEDEDVSLGILSPEHVNLLGECATRWRLPASFRSWVFLEAIVQRAEQGLVPTACIHEATGMVGKVSADMDVSSWANSDQEGLERAMHQRDACILSAVANALTYERGYHSAEFQEAVEDWLSLDSQDIRHPDLIQMAAPIIDGIKVQAYESYIAEASDRIEHEGGKNRAFAINMATWIEKQTKKLSKKFPEPISNNIDVVGLVLQQMLRLYFGDLEDAMSVTPPPGEPGNDMEEAFGLYRRANKLVEMGNAFSSEPVSHNLAPSFEHTVKLWLDQTATKTKQWADAALGVDTFEPVSENGPSSSVTDLFDSFRSACDFLMDLNWPDEYQLAAFATRLARIFSHSINEYCNKLEQLFAKEMTVVAEEIVQPVAAPSSQKAAWIEKARSTIANLQGEKKIQAFFNFVPQSCTKLNNIESARQQLDKLYQDMRVDDLAAYDTSETVKRADQQSYLFTVKIVHAEGLTQEGGSGRNPDTFAILSDEHGNRYAKTRTIYDDADPRWDETFDIPAKGTAWFMVTLRHRVLAGKHDLLGRAYLRLDPNQFADLISKDVLLPLDSRGHVLLRISMEGERDDIQFHFGRAFRWLKRTESDMVRTFVDKTLSRNSIKSVIKPQTSSLPTVNLPNMQLPQIDYNEALGKLTSAYRSAMGTPDYAIPPPESEIPPPPNEKPITTPTSAVSSAKRGRMPTDAEIESAIHPLFDYLDANNHTLASTLSKDAMQMVMAKLWKQILMTIEALIVPPLSDKPSHMRALTDGELDIALKWLKFLRDFFYVGGDESGVPLSVLQNQKFNEILSVRIYYDWRTDDLMEECIRGFQSTLKNRALKPSKSLISQRNLGTIRARKSAKRALPAGQNNTEMIMRILRMRSGTQEFLAQQLQTISVVKMENPKHKKTIQGSMNRYSR